MIDIRMINAFTVSQFCNHIRNFFINNNFEEIVLYDTASYNITNSNQIKTEDGEYLRTTTEPEIWEFGSKYDKFYCLTSLFRQEISTSLIHKKEFKILDFYIRNSTEEEVLSVVLNCMEFLEKKLNLPSLSAINVHRCTFEMAKDLNYSQYSGSILKIEQYPIEESFYDQIDHSTGKTKKGELFYINDSTPVEFCTYGQVGENKNHINRVANFKFDQNILASLDIYGACIGIERIIFCYELLKHKRGGA